MIKLIGLSGKAGSGKNALADYIQSTAPNFYVQDSFAAPLKNGLASILGISLEELNERKDTGELHPDLGITYRNMLQTLGTEWGRDIINKDMWNILMKQRVNSNLDKMIIITDVRFNNEAELVHQMGGKVILIDRPINQCRTVTPHASENSLDDHLIDYTFDNSGSLEDLYKKWDHFRYIMREEWS